MLAIQGIKIYKIGVLSDCLTTLPKSCETYPYSCTIWVPHSQTDIQSVEAVQRRAARFTLNHYGKYQSVTSMLDELDWPTLQTRRNQLKLMMLFIKNNSWSHTCAQQPTPNPDDILRGHTFKFTKPATRVDCYTNFHFSLSSSVCGTL